MVPPFLQCLGLCSAVYLHIIPAMHLLIALLLCLMPTAVADTPSTIEMGMFIAEVVDNKVVCSWMTHKETVEGHYYIQNSDNGHRWETIGRLAAKGPESTENNYYSFTYPGNHRYPYYRLVFRSAGGTQLLLGQEKVSFYARIQFQEARLIKEEHKFHLYYLIDKNKKLLIRLYDQIGQQVLTDHLPSGEAGYYTYDIDLSPLKKGAYLLVITQEEYNLDVAEYRFTYQ